MKKSETWVCAPPTFADPFTDRHPVVSARIWLCLYWFDHQWVSHNSLVTLITNVWFRMSLGAGRPIILRDEPSIRHCRILLSHPMASPTDVRLVSLVELIKQKSLYLILRTLLVSLTSGSIQRKFMKRSRHSTVKSITAL